MPRFRLLLEYAGTRYSGWQIQRNARTIQGELERAAAELAGGRPVESYGSGRTDAGVHALGQVAHLDLDTPLSPDRLRLALDDRLPPDVHVLRLERVSHRFHARRDAVARSYLYQVSRRRTAFGKPFVWWVKDPLEAAAMAEAATRLEGFHDFRSFSDADPGAGSTRVEVRRVAVGEEGDLILVRVVGSHFLWKMVRRMVGVLVEVGRGGLQPEDVSRFLEEPSGVPARLTAPPSGLFLERVLYEGEGPLDEPLRAAFPVPRPSPPAPGERRAGDRGPARPRRP